MVQLVSTLASAGFRGWDLLPPTIYNTRLLRFGSVHPQVSYSSGVAMMLHMGAAAVLSFGTEPR